MGLNLPTGIPFVYELDENMKPVVSMKFLGKIQFGDFSQKMTIKKMHYNFAIKHLVLPSFYTNVNFVANPYKYIYYLDI